MFENAYRPKKIEQMDVETKEVDDTESSQKFLVQQKILGNLCHELLEGCLSYYLKNLILAAKEIILHL